MEEQKRTFDDLMKALMEDPDWDCPMEERAWHCNDSLAWIVNQL